MIRFFEQNLRYPESYKGTGTKVRLFYSFTIDSLGMLQNPVSYPRIYCILAIRGKPMMSSAMKPYGYSG